MELTPEMKERMWKTGQSGNPRGNYDGHSTKRFSKLINELLDSEDVDFEDLRKNAKTMKAREAVTMALIKRAMGYNDAPPDTAALKLLMEWADGKLENQLDVKTNGESLKTATDYRLEEMLERIRAAKE